MKIELIIILLIVISIVLFLVIRWFNNDRRAQRALDKYLNSSLSSEEIGRFYERYIGYLYEIEGREVIYHGALNGGADLGRDLIVKCDDKIFIIQTKCWSKNKRIQEKHIFQLYGSMTHYKLTSRNIGFSINSVFYTTTEYSEVAKSAAQVLGVGLKTKSLNRSYPMIKCKVFENGNKSYYLPFDPYYDEFRIERHRGEFFVTTVKEAVAMGFQRSKSV